MWVDSVDFLKDYEKNGESLRSFLVVLKNATDRNWAHIFIITSPDGGAVLRGETSFKVFDKARTRFMSGKDIGIDFYLSRKKQEELARFGEKSK